MKNIALKHVCLALALLVGPVEQAAAVAYRLDGIVTSVTEESFPNTGIVVGQSFSALLTFDEVALGTTDPAPTPRGYVTSATLRLKIGGEWVLDYNGNATGFHEGLFYLESFLEPAPTAFGEYRTWFRILLTDPTGPMSDALDQPLNVSDWGSAGFASGAGIGPNFHFNGALTSISQVPDSGATAGLLALAGLLVVTARKIVRA